ncbi:MAG TPA: hypothetical protein VD866_17680 [Urbifossiella sp.]|nr:hypothetical protein [Urbifossiella sp.]
MELICGGWVAFVVLALTGRALWKASQAVADWKPSPPRPKPPTPPPPKPTAEQVAAAAKEKYEARVRWLEGAGLDPIELHAGQLKAKQTYLRELDGVL